MDTLESQGILLNLDSVENRITRTLHCENLRPLDEKTSLNTCATVATFLTSLPYLSSPAIYWFEIQSCHTSEEVYEAFATAKAKVNRRFSFSPEQSNSTSVLYVGKVSKDIRGRMITHLGYASNPETPGLQLCHWAHSLRLKVQVNAIILPQSDKSNLLTWEAQIAKVLKPLIGKW